MLILRRHRLYRVREKWKLKKKIGQQNVSSTYPPIARAQHTISLGLHIISNVLNMTYCARSNSNRLYFLIIWVWSETIKSNDLSSVWPTIGRQRENFQGDNKANLLEIFNKASDRLILRLPVSLATCFCTCIQCYTYVYGQEDSDANEVETECILQCLRNGQQSTYQRTESGLYTIPI